MSKTQSNKLDYHQEQINADRKRGAFVLRMPSGKEIKFKTAEQRGNAYRGLSEGRFESVGQMVDFAKNCPNGYTKFGETDYGNN